MLTALYQDEQLVRRLERFVAVRTAHFLDVGCGTGRLGEVVAPHVARYVGVDRDHEAIRQARGNLGRFTNVELLVADAEELPFQREFDVVGYRSSFHLVKNPFKALYEAGKVLKEGGVIAIIEPSQGSPFLGGVLSPYSAEFDQEAYARKMAALERSAAYIERQTMFPIAERGHNPRLKLDAWFLRKDD